MRGVNLFDAPVGAPLPRIISGVQERQAHRSLTQTPADLAWLFEN
jgi:hypothetical protein